LHFLILYFTGKLCLIQPESLLPELRSALLASAQRPIKRTTIVTGKAYPTIKYQGTRLFGDYPTLLVKLCLSLILDLLAVKFTISDVTQAIDPLLRCCIGDFLATLNDSDLNVRRVALVTFNSAAHNKPSLIKGLLPTFLPKLYNETKVSRCLHYVVQMSLVHKSISFPYRNAKSLFERWRWVHLSTRLMTDWT